MTKKIVIYLDADKDLQMAGLPGSPADVEGFEEDFIKAAERYGADHGLDITVETNPEAVLDENFDEILHTKVWQGIHNMITL